MFRELRGLQREMYLRTQIEQLAKVYMMAQKRLVAQLKLANLTDFQRFRAERLLHEVEIITTSLDRSAYKWANDTMPMSYDRGIDLAAERLKAMNVTRFVSYDASIHTSAINILIDDVAKELLISNDGMKKFFNRVIRMTQQTVLQDTEISKMIAEGLIEGQARRTISDTILKGLRSQLNDEKFIVINGRNYRPDSYAKLIARTRTREATSKGTVNTSLRYGVDLVQIDVHSNACEFCQQHEGRVFSISGTDPDFPVLVEQPPYHPHCCLPETPVFAPGQFAAFVSTYKGPVFDVRLSNSARFSVTANHMFLTPSGFVRARDFRKGDEILYSSLFERVILGNPDNYGKPSTIKQVVESFSKSKGVSTVRVPTSSEYLHGDGEFIDGYVDIIAPDSFLKGDIKSKFCEDVSQFNFTDSDINMFSLAGCRDSASMLFALRDATNRGMGRGYNALLFQGGPGSINKNLSRGLIPESNSGSQKTTSDSFSFNPKKFSNTLRGLKGEISFANIDSISVRQFHGHVYDLHTFSSLYFVNGALSSNCECNLVPVTKEALIDRGQFDSMIKFSNSPLTKIPTFSRFEEILASL